MLDALAWFHGPWWAHEGVRRAAWVVVVWVIAIVLTRVAKRLFDRIDRNLTDMGEPARALVKLDFAVNFFVYLVAVFVTLSILGVGQALWGAVALTGVAGVVVALAAQQFGENLIAGLVILFEKPYRVGDVVRITDQTGTVRKVSLYGTVLESAEGPRILVPNSKVLGAAVTNFSQVAARRVTVTIDVKASKDLDQVARILRAAIDTDEHLVKGRPVTVFAKETLDEGILFEAWYWVQRDAYMPHCNNSAKQRLYDALTQAGYSTTMPARRMHQGED